MNRLRVEGLLAAFPKLVGHAKQHTFVETDTVRYVYQPLENQLFLLLITTKASNIVEDLGTLRLLAKVVPDVAGGFQEHAIQEHAFDLIFAFDEVLTAGGYKEEATLNTIRTNLLMDSHEEKIQTAIRENQEAEARKRMMDQAKKIQEQKMQQTKQNFFQGGGGSAPLGGMEGFGGGGYQDPYQQQQQQPPPPEVSDPYANLYSNQNAVPEQPKVLAKGGMKLGGGGGGMGNKMGGKSQNLMAAMAAEDNLFGGSALGAKTGGSNAFDIAAAPPKPTATPSTPLTLALEEKVTATMTREGAVESAEVKGTLTLTANTDAGAAAIVTVNKAQLPANFNYATHPKVDKKAYEAKNGVLSLKGGKGFPLNRPVGILRWSLQSEEVAPITINCWPEDDGAGSINVNIEMELTRTDVSLSDVNILLPLGTTDPPAIESIDGQYKHDPRQGMMCWHFDQVDASNNATGTLEFTVPGHDPEAFFPIQVMFHSTSLLCPIQVVSVVSSATNAPIPNELIQSFVPDTYQCA